MPPVEKLDSMAAIKANWMDNVLAPLIQDTPPPKKEDTKNGKESADDRPGDNAPPNKPPVGSEPVGGQPDKGGAGDKLTGLPETVVGDKAAAAQPVAEPKPAPAGKEPAKDAKTVLDKLPVPKNSKEWDKAKTTWYEIENSLKKDLAERDQRLTELQAQLTEASAKAQAGAELAPEIKTQLEHKDAQIKELSERIQILDVTQHPKFQRYFGDKTEAALAKAKKLVGADNAERIEKILKLPEGEYKNAQLEEFLGGIDSDLGRTRLGVVIEELENINLEREAEIKKAGEHRDKINGEQALLSEQGKKVRQQTFDQTLQGLQDAKKGFAPFQFRADDKEWNDGVTKRVEAARDLLFGEKVKPEQVAQAAFYAVTLPLVLKSYGADAEKWKQEKAGFEAKIAELVAAEPKRGDGGGGEAESENPLGHIKPGATRTELDRGTIKRVMKLINE